MLRESGVGTGIHYPVPVHCQPAYAGRVALGPSGCPETENAAKEILSLPIYPEMTDPAGRNSLCCTERPVAATSARLTDCRPATFPAAE